MKKMIVIGILGMVLVGLASAGLLDYYGKVVEVVEVSGLVFYFDDTGLMNDGSDSLNLDYDDVNGNFILLTSGTGDSKELFSEPLGADGFYPLKFETTIDAEMFGLNESSEDTGSIHMFVFLSRESGSVRKLISLCDSIYIGMNERKEYDISCDVGDALVDIEPSDRIKVLLNDGSPTGSSARIYFGSSKMRMVAK